ncbi:MAG: NUDIX hydrolase [Rhodocyclales bacterium]|nr:NUDIX hydrolase [Rhodocyclales bacterium]
MTAHHCSQCGSRMVLATIGERQREQCPACGFIAWRNPAPVAMAVIEHERKLVLIRRGETPLAGYWAPPAGYVETGESVPAAVIREAREECGLDIVLDELSGVYSQADVEVLIIAYRAHSIGGQLIAGDDASEVGLFACGQLPAQPVPADGTATDCWLHEVILDVTAPWRRIDILRATN